MSRSAARHPETRAGFPAGDILQRRASLAALALITLAGEFRFYQLSHQGFWIDEAFSVAFAKAILEQGYPLLPNDVLSWKNFSAHYPMALGIALFDDVETGARFFPALAGTLLVPAVYALAHTLFRSRSQALLAAGLVACLSYEIAWSRQARMYAFLDLYLVLALLFYYRFLANREPRELFAGVAFAFLAVGAHRAGYIAPMALALSGAVEARRVASWRDWIGTHRRAAAGLAVSCLAIAGVLALLKTDSSIGDVVANLQQDGPRSYLGSYAKFIAGQLGSMWMWALAGVVLAVWRFPRESLPLLIAAAAYLYVISQKNLLFHHRYLLPLMWMLLLFAALAFDRALWTCWRSPRRLGKAGAVLTVAVFGVSLGTGHFTLRAHPNTFLGPTAPQPDWRAAYRWVAADHATRGGGADRLVTIANFTVFHDIYLGERAGEKYFLPFSLTGIPGRPQRGSPYSRAKTITSLAELQSLRGYVILDRFGLQLQNRDIVRFLRGRKPTYTVRGPRHYYVHIWRL